MIIRRKDKNTYIKTKFCKLLDGECFILEEDFEKESPDFFIKRTRANNKVLFEMNSFNLKRNDLSIIGDEVSVYPIDAELLWNFRKG